MEERVQVGTGVMIVKDGKVLLGKRSYTDEKKALGIKGDGEWTFPGGKMDWGEDPLACAVRETQEETGLTPVNVRFLAVNNDFYPPTHFVTVGFYTEEVEGELENREAHKFETWEWFPLEDLPAPLFAPSAKMIRNWKEGRAYIEENVG